VEKYSQISWVFFGIFLVLIVLIIAELFSLNNQQNIIVPPLLRIAWPILGKNNQYEI